MRNDHHGKNNKLVKRAFALCLALAVICSCLLPVFATEGGWIATQELDASTQIATMDTAFGVDGEYGIDVQEADASASSSQSSTAAAQPDISTGGISRPVSGGVVVGPVVDDSTSDSTSSGSTSESTASSTTGTSEVITDPSTITDADIPEGATDIVRNSNGSYSYTMPYGRVTVFPTKEGEKTTWTGEETVITRDDDRLKEDDAAFGVLPIEYHFWLKQMDSDTFRELDWEAQMAEMSETEYLALFGASDKFPIWHMDTISSVDTISNYKFANPTSKNDPAGEDREFAYWYTVDENGVKCEFDPYQSYGSTTNTIINVYAAWKDASGDVVEDTKKDETATSDEKKNESEEEGQEGSIEIVSIQYANPKDAIATYSSIQGDNKVPVGATIKLRGNNGKSDYYHTWKIETSNGGAATFISNGQNVSTISGQGDTYKEVTLKVTSEGKVTIRHRYGKDQDTTSGDTLVITVVKANSTDNTGTYKLYVYTQIPGYADANYESEKQHNSVWNGMSIGTISGVFDPSTVDAGTIYSSSQISDKLGTDIVVDSAQFPVIPILQDDKITYVDYYYESDPRRPNGAPYYTIDWYRVVVSSGANTGKNGADGDWGNDTDAKNKYTSGIYASPITAVSGNQYHLDGKLHFHDNVHINVDFMVQDAGKTGFDLQEDYTAIYKTDKDKNNEVSLKNAHRPDKDSLNGNNWVATPLFRETKKVGNITYKFDGWYTNKACTGDKFNFDTDVIKEDTTFYAKYVPYLEETTVTIGKQVTGLMGDTQKAFNFVVTVTNGTENITSQVSAVYENGSTADLNGFTLKHNQTITLTGVPVGATVTVTETAPGKSYTVKATGYEDGQSGENNAIFYYTVVARPSADEATVVSEDEELAVRTVVAAVEASDIVVTNHCGLLPDTGVLLDTLPYIVILAVVAGGGVLLMLRKRRKEDD